MYERHLDDAPRGSNRQMSEQFAIQTEDFESTNDRLDSILDRLNALGQSVTEATTAPARTLESVPDLVDDDIENDIYAGLYDDPVVPPRVEPVVEDTADVAVLDRVEVDDVEEDDLAVVDVEANDEQPGGVLTSERDDVPDLVPPAMPPLGLVPPVPLSRTTEDAESTTDVDSDVDEVRDGEAFSSLDVVDTGADFESVTALDDTAAVETAGDEAALAEVIPLETNFEPPLDENLVVDEDELAPADLDDVDSGWASEWATVDNEAIEHTELDDVITDEDILLAEAAESDAVAAELTAADEFEAATSTEIAHIATSESNAIAAPAVDAAAEELLVQEDGPALFDWASEDTEIGAPDVFELEQTETAESTDIANATDTFADVDTEGTDSADANVPQIVDVADTEFVEPELAPATPTETTAVESSAVVGTVAEEVVTTAPVMDETAVSLTQAADAPLVAPPTEPLDVPVDVEFHEIAVTPDPDAHFEAQVEAQVFELDEFDVVEAESVEAPSAPTSIFGSGFGFGKKKSEPSTEDEESDGWVSHHGTDDVEPFAVSNGDTDSTVVAAAPDQSYNATEDPQWSLDEPIAGSIFDQSTAAPDPVEQADPSLMADEVEQVLGEIGGFDTAADPFAALDATDGPVTIAGIDSPLGADAVDAEIYATDEDLPLPDFTGVYDEDLDVVPAAVESKVSSAISVGRGELDSLRPTDDEPEESELAIAEEKKGANWSPILQLIFVVGFGVAVLVYIWLQDPTAVEDMRRELNNLLGR